MKLDIHSYNARVSYDIVLKNCIKTKQTNKDVWDDSNFSFHKSLNISGSKHLPRFLFSAYKRQTFYGKVN